VTIESFEIVIKGTLSPPVAAAFSGFAVTRIERGRTHLVGPIQDQAGLRGLLETLGGLNIELISVNPVTPREGE
jgi:hypothetical protein